MILGIDPGTKRVGIAAADEETRFARPVEVTPAEAAVERILQLIAEMDVTSVVIGRPVSMSGQAKGAVEEYEGLVSELRRSVPENVSVVEHDERLTSVIANRSLQAGGVSAKKARGIVDAVAAQVMLQGYLDAGQRS